MGQRKTYTGRVEALKRGARKDMTGLWVEIYNVTDKMKSKYDDFCSDKYEADYAAIFENGGVGALFSITKEQSDKDDRFWNIREVVPMEDKGSGQGEPDRNPPAKEAAKDAVKSAPKLTGIKPGLGKSYTTIDVATTALTKAINLMAAIMASDNVKKTAKMTPEMVIDLTLVTASTMGKFLTGEYTPEVKSDTADLNKKGVDAKEAEVPGDEPLVDENGDEVPF